MKILGYNYTLDSIFDTEELGGNAGKCYAGSQHISLAKNLTVDGAESTLIHEIIEAVDYHLELKLEHKQICALEVALYNVLKENGVDLVPLLKGIIVKQSDLKKI